MALDRVLKAASQRASKEAAQNNAVANRLLAWFTRLSEEEVSRETYSQFYDQVLGELKIDGAGNAN